MFDIFKDTSDDELKSIYNDILKSEEDGLRAKSLDFYAENLREFIMVQRLYLSRINFRKLV